MTKVYISEALEPLEKRKRASINRYGKKKFITFVLLYIVTIVIVYEGIIPIFSRLEKELGIWWYVVGIVVILYFCKEKEEDKIQSNKGIWILNEELEVVANDVKDICNILDIEVLYLRINEIPDINAECFIEDKEISVNRGLIVDLKEKMRRKLISEREYKSILLQTITHEIGHLYNKDSRSYIEKRAGRVSLVSVFLFVFSILLIYISRNVCVAMILYVVIGVYELLFGRVMSDKRYWNQIAELKADRMIIEIHGNVAKEYRKYWWSKEVIEKERQKSRKRNEKGILYRIYKKYVEINDHPPIWRREYVTRHRNRWYWWEYFEHALLINKWRFEGKGWRGV